MPRKAVNPGVGRGHGERPVHEQVCECGAAFFAARSDARCEKCKAERARIHGSRPRPERVRERVDGKPNEPGVGKGNYARGQWKQRAVELPTERRVICKRCFAAFVARRKDAKWCPDCKAIKDKEKLARFESRSKSPCPDCGNPKARKAAHCRACDGKLQSTLGTHRGERNGNWKGGTTEAKGYRLVRKQRGKTAYALEHIAVWEDINGPLPKGWVIHHLNGTKDDNRLENLAGMPRLEHHHHPREALRPYEARIRDLEARLLAAGLPLA